MKTKGYASIAGLEDLSPGQIRQRNIEIYGKKIRAFRTRAGLSADQLADKLQVSGGSVRNWECGLSRPDPEYLFRMFRILDVEPNEFFGIGGVGTLLTTAERNLLQDYRALDHDGKEDAQAMLSALSRKAYERRLRGARERMRAVPDRGRRAAAGNGTQWPDRLDEGRQVILYASPAVSRADEIITVSGESMAPQFHDQDQVLVQYTTQLRNGDIGIFFVRGIGGVIKQKLFDRLHSLNEAYEDIYPFEETGAELLGRVLGKVESDMRPSPEEQEIYLESLEAYRSEEGHSEEGGER